MSAFTFLSGRLFVVFALVLAVASLAFAVVSQQSIFFFAGLAFAILPAFVRGPAARQAPSLEEITRYLEWVLGSRGYGGVFDLRVLKPRTKFTFSGRHDRVQFRAVATVRQPLYGLVDAPWREFEDFTPRKLNAVRHAVDRLVDEMGAAAGDLKASMPADLFTAGYIGVRTPARRELMFSGELGADRSSGAWTFTLHQLGCEQGGLESLGRPLDSFRGVVVLGTPEGDRWIGETVAAWREFCEKVSTLQRQLEAARSDRGRQALTDFFQMVQAGSIFHGVGRSVSEQHAPTPFFLEVRSVGGDDASLLFTLRNDSAWEHARRFVARVDYDETERAVCLRALTERNDAFECGGPVVGADTAFALSFRFTAGVPPRLESFGGDLVMELTEIPRTALSALRARVYMRQQQIAAVVAPGRSYTGRATLRGAEIPFTLSFFESCEIGRRVEARIESNGWSGMFDVNEHANPYAGPECELTLEPFARPVEVAASATLAASCPPSAWKRVELRLANEDLAGRVETSSGGTLEVDLQPQLAAGAPAEIAAGSGCEDI